MSAGAAPEMQRTYRLTGENKFRINLGEAQGTLTDPRDVCVSLSQKPPSLVSPDFFFWKLFLIVIECSTAYSKYHSYKFLASIFQSDHYLIFKTKQNKNPKESKTTEQNQIYTSYTQARPRGFPLFTLQAVF